MTSPFPAHRAAEEFDRVLEGRASEDVAERYADLLPTVGVLRVHPQVEPRAEFVADLRARLMTAAETDLVAAPAVVRSHHPSNRRPAPHGGRRLATAAAALVILGGAGGVAAAASGALPGEALYPVKRGTEQVTTAVHFGDASKGRALLGQAGNRLDEVQALLSSGSTDEATVSSTVEAFTDAAYAGSQKLFTAYEAGDDSADLGAVRAFAADRMDQVSAMTDEADPPIDGLLRDAADALADIDQQALDLCGGSCGTGPALTPPKAVTSSAGAASVDNLVARPVAQADADIAVVRAVARVQQLGDLAALRAAAQQSATRLQAALDAAAASAPGEASGTASGSGAGAAARRPPVTSHLTDDGDLVPVATGATTAVRGLVSGVTGTVSGLTSSVPGGSALDPVTGTLTKATDQLTRTLDQAVGEVTGGLTDGGTGGTGRGTGGGGTGGRTGGLVPPTNP